MHATNGLLEGAQEMRDLILAEGLVDASGQASAYAGAFASTSATAGSVEFWNLVNQSVAVRGSGDAGSVASGIVGLNGRTSVFVGCANRAPVSAASIVGGIVGINPSDSATFYLCANEGSISAAPGLNPSMANGIGYANNATAEACYNTGSVSADVSAAGLFSFQASAVVKDSYNSGAVSAAGSGGTAYQIASTFTGESTYYNSSLAAGAGTGTAEGKSAADMKTAGFASTLDGPLSISDTVAGDINLKDYKWVRTDGTNKGFPYITSRLRDNWAAVGAEQVEADLRTADVPGSTGLKALSGAGSEASPYVVSTPEALAWYAYQVNQHSTTDITNSDGSTPGLTYDYAYVQLGADIDLLGAAYGGTVDDAGATAADKYAGVLDWVPMDQKAPHFDGQGHTIDYLYINVSDKDNQGLFGNTTAEAADASFIRNTSVGAQSYVRGKTHVGALVGQAKTTELANCSNAAEVSGEIAGGVAGSCEGRIIGCSNAGAISGYNYVGGVVGSPGSGSVSNCFNIGAVSANEAYGGAGGIGAYGAVEYVSCYNAGPIKGYIRGAITADTNSSKCYNCLYDTGTSAGDASKPVTGCSTPGYTHDGDDAHGKVEGVSSAALKSWGAAYQLSRVSATPNDSGAFDYASVTDLANMTTWRQATGDEAAGTLENNGYPVLCATGETLQAATDWSQVGAWIDTFLTVDEKIDQRVPGATAGEPLGYKPDTSTNNGTTADLAIELPSPEALAWFAYKTNNTPAEVISGSTTYKNAYTKLGANIDLEGKNYGGSADESKATAADKYANVLDWVAMNQYAPHFDGKGHTIDHLYINAPEKSQQGLFGMTDSSAQDNFIQNVSIGSQSYVRSKTVAGGLAGSVTYVNFTNCSNAAEISTEPGRPHNSSAAGGIAGYLHEGNVSGCSNTGAVTAEGYSNAGGIAGGGFKNKITNCFNTGAVTAGVAGPDDGGTSTASGIIVRSSYGDGIMNCYNTGTVSGTTADPVGAYTGVVANCYYLADTATDLADGKAARTADQFASGQVAWELDTATEAGANVGGAHRGTWGQNVGRTNDGEVDTTLGDALPTFLNASAHPAVFRANTVFDPAALPSEPAAAVFGNANDKAKLPTPSTGALMKYYKGSTSTDVSDVNKLTSPITLGTADLSVYATPAAYATWAEVGADQTEEALRLTYWDDTSSTWKKAADAASVPADALVALAGDGTTSLAALTIASPEALAWFMSAVNKDDTIRGETGWIRQKARDAHVKLAANISLQGTKASGAMYDYVTAPDTALPWIPIANKSTSIFTGSVDGQGFEVDYLHLDGTLDGAGLVQGLFGYFSGSLKNLGIGQNGTISGSETAGALVGAGETGVTVEGCWNKAEVSATATAGGVAGLFAGSMAGCTNYASVTAVGDSTYAPRAAGLVGYGSLGNYITITDCLNKGSVSAPSGIASGIHGGSAGSGTRSMSNCLSAGPVSGDSTYALNADSSFASVTNCYYNIVTITFTPAAGEEGMLGSITSVTPDQLASGQVAWALDTALADGSSTGNVHRDVWGQKVGRNATTGELDSTGDTVERCVVSNAHPRVLALAQNFEDAVFGDDTTEPTQTFYANAGSKVKLAVPTDTSKKHRYVLTGNESGTDPAVETAIKSPYTVVAGRTTDLAITVKNGAVFSSWQELATAVDEGKTVKLMNDTDKDMGTFKPDTSMNDGSTADKAIRIDSPEALAWWAYKTTGKYALITENIDLFGTAYTGVTVGSDANDLDGATGADGIPDNITDALVWPNTTTGTLLDGGGFTIEHLYATNGLLKDPEAMRNLTLAAGLVDAAGQEVWARAGAFASTTLSYRSPIFANLVNESVAVRGSGGSDGRGFAGGIVGESCYYPVFVGCTNRAPVSAAGNVGGITGYGSGNGCMVSFYRCSNEGTVDNSDVMYGHAAGIGSAISKIQAEACFNTGIVAGESGAKGLFHTQDTSSVKNSYNSGTVTVADASKSAYQIAYGSNFTVESSYYNSDPGTAEPGVDSGVTGKTTAEMKTDAFADLLNEVLATSTTEVDGIKLADYAWVRADSTNGGYPYTQVREFLSWADVAKIQTEARLRLTGVSSSGAQTVYSDAAALTASGDTPALAGGGTGANDQLRVATPEAFAWFAFQVTNGGTIAGSDGSGSQGAGNANVVLVRDISLLGTLESGAAKDYVTAGSSLVATNALPWKSVGTFSGTFSGGGNTVDGLYVYHDKGLFSALNGTGSISGLTIGANSLIDAQANTGAVAAWIEGSAAIRDCVNEASVKSSMSAAGIAADVLGTATIERCGNVGAISANDGTGAVGCRYCWVGARRGHQPYK